jgi:hypothetical protein
VITSETIITENIAPHTGSSVKIIADLAAVT